MRDEQFYLLETCFGWRGILAEPNPIFHNELRTNRVCHISTLCIAARSGDVVQFNQARDALLSTMDDYSAADHHAAARAGGTIIPVETLSLIELLAQQGAPESIDYLSIDTEGSEFDILAAFDFKRYDIRLITVEHNFSRRRDDLHTLLAAQGYRRKFVEHTAWDDWYVKIDK
jgi:FkbM family methyltransferase